MVYNGAMKIICLDVEGVLTPEIWIAFSEATGIPEFRRTTRDEPDYDKLMRYRIELLDTHNLKLPDIQRVIATVKPLEGAKEFVRKIRERTQLILLSDTFEQFAKPIMAQLDYPTLFCNNLLTDESGKITGYNLRQKDGKKFAVLALKSINMQVFAAGDSFNDLKMIREADAGCLFRAPDKIREDNSDIPCYDSYEDFYRRIDEFLSA